MASNEQYPRVYTLPDCPNCTTLKSWLVEAEMGFEERPFDTEAQVKFIMKNIFGSPPILEVGPKILPSEEIFFDEVLDEAKVKEVLKSD
jgi:glutaredoxin